MLLSRSCWDISVEHDLHFCHHHERDCQQDYHSIVEDHVAVAGEVRGHAGHLVFEGLLAQVQSVCCR